jgi:hypothetical protein
MCITLGTHAGMAMDEGGTYTTMHERCHNNSSVDTQNYNTDTRT